MRGTALLLPVLLAAALAACGGPDAAERSGTYVERLNDATDRFARAATTLTAEVTADSSAAQDRATLGRYASAVDRVVADLRAIRPPDEVAPLHRRYVRLMRDYGEEIERAVGALSSANAPGQARAAGQRLRLAAARVDADVGRAIAAINRALER